LADRPLERFDPRDCPQFGVTFVPVFEPAAVLDGLDDAQREAATYAGGPLLVLAGAGAGKTRTLVARAAWLLGQGLDPARVLLLTFTRRAAEEMMSRAAAQAGNVQRTISGGTFHSVAHRIIRRHAESFSLPPQFTVIDPGDVTDLFDVLRAGQGLAETGRRAPRAAVIADIYCRCVSTGSPVGQVIRECFPWCADYASDLAQVFRVYVAHKRAHGLVDFDDLLLLWRAALTDPAAGPVLAGMFDAVLVDEYQDVNAVQADIVRLLAPDGAGLTCVGDDAQAVYGFRGADPAHLRRLGEVFPALAIIRLARNYRSAHPLVALANAVRPQSPGLELTLVAERAAGGTRPALVRCHDEAAQAREITARILNARENGTDLRDQAVLIRASHHSDVLEIELAARRIPYKKYGGLRFTEAAHVRDFLAALRIMVNPADDIAWFRILRLHDGLGPATARRLTAILRLADPGPWDRWPDAVAASPPRSRQGLAATFTALAAAAQCAESADTAGGTARLATVVLAALDPLLRARYPDHPARLADLHRLADAATTRPSLHDALVELALDPPVSAADLAGPPGLDEDYLIISTIHAAKGLEWPIVHLPHLVDGAIPSDLALAARDGLGEEHRLFYVALTRARDQLHLYAPHRLHHHRHARDDRHSLGQLTRFLTPQAQAACHLTHAAPTQPTLPPIGALTARIDTDLDSLWTS
jgi:DNA helicase II / ATP-dependent DNA helicase PcrA